MIVVKKSSSKMFISMQRWWKVRVYSNKFDIPKLAGKCDVKGDSRDGEGGGVVCKCIR
jgi:hypothetical protein